MLFVRSILPVALFLVLTPLLATDPPSGTKESRYDLEAFQKLLNQADPPSLHAALHDFSPKKFKHGMFPEDRTAVEAIHKEEPGLATGIVKMAKLSKRQSNATITTSSSSQTPESSSTPVASEADDLTSASSASVLESITSSSAPATTSAPTTSSDIPSSSLSDGQLITTTNDVGLVVVSTVGGGATTISPSGSSSSRAALTRSRSSLTSTLVRTSTLPDGGKSTITAITVVGAVDDAGDTPTGTAGVGASDTGTGQPGLQTGEAMMTRGCGREMAVVLGAAVGVAFML